MSGTESMQAAALWKALSDIEASLGDGYLDGRSVLPNFSAPDLGAPDLGAACLEPEVSPPKESLEDIRAQAVRCLKCRLAASRTHAVFGQGVERPLVLVVGEGPGAEEDKSGKPFVGPAGQLLDKMLASIGLSRDSNVYIANIVKCRPPMNRDPAPDEQAACLPYLDRQLAVLRPKAILALGRIPSQALLKSRDGIGKLRGTVWDFQGLPLVPTYHPSALLREESLKRPAWEDLKLLKSVLGDG